MEGDERYTFTSSDTIRKVDRTGEPDLIGIEYKLLSGLEDGYTVYAKPIDPSQPNPTYFIHKRYFITSTSKQ